ncbi:unnamed protein product [Lasius platythorax]|uniref:Uncharacterized protein n=1 Tax=Lasius platythorax TaxID=488582 RepID=A0AAV2NH63_9HYME
MCGDSAGLLARVSPGKTENCYANHHTEDAIPSDLPQRADARTSLCQREIPGVFGDRLVSPSVRQSFRRVVAANKRGKLVPLG